MIQCLTDCLRSVREALAAAGIPEGTAYQKVKIQIFACQMQCAEKKLHPEFPLEKGKKWYCPFLAGFSLSSRRCYNIYGRQLSWVQQ